MILNLDRALELFVYTYRQSVRHPDLRIQTLKRNHAARVAILRWNAMTHAQQLEVACQVNGLL
jgi:hypothetical protein